MWGNHTTEMKRVLLIRAVRVILSRNWAYQTSSRIRYFPAPHGHRAFSAAWKRPWCWYNMQLMTPCVRNSRLSILVGHYRARNELTSWKAVSMIFLLHIGSPICYLNLAHIQGTREHSLRRSKVLRAFRHIRPFQTYPLVYYNRAVPFHTKGD
jgi:hypothetical protein